MLPSARPRPASVIAILRTTVGDMPVSQHTIAGIAGSPCRCAFAPPTWAFRDVLGARRPSAAPHDYSGLRCEYLPGKARWMVRYVSTGIWAIPRVRHRDHGEPAWYSNAAGPEPYRAVAFIHHSPVQIAFTLEAGRTIWGFLVIMADFTTDGRGSLTSAPTDGWDRVCYRFAGADPGGKMLKTYPTDDGVTRDSLVQSLARAPARRRPTAVGRPSLRQRTGIAGPAEAPLLSQSAANVE